MHIPFLIVRKRKDWMITWKENKLRWILFYYLVGLIIACLTTFLEETFFPVPVRYLYKSLNVTVFTPVIVVALWTYLASRAER
jgi:Na+/serine symporter